MKRPIPPHPLDLSGWNVWTSQSMPDHCVLELRSRHGTIARVSMSKRTAPRMAYELNEASKTCDSPNAANDTHRTARRVRR